MEVIFSLTKDAKRIHSLTFYLAVGPSIPPAVSYSKRAQANSVESEHKDDWDKDMSRKLSSTTVGSKGEMAASPLVGPERKKSSTTPSVSQIFVQCWGNSYRSILVLASTIDQQTFTPMF